MNPLLLQTLSEGETWTLNHVQSRTRNGKLREQAPGDVRWGLLVAVPAASYPTRRAKEAGSGEGAAAAAGGIAVGERAPFLRAL